MRLNPLRVGRGPASWSITAVRTWSRSPACSWARTSTRRARSVKRSNTSRGYAFASSGDVGGLQAAELGVGRVLHLHHARSLAGDGRLEQVAGQPAVPEALVARLAGEPRQHRLLRGGTE